MNDNSSEEKSFDKCLGEDLAWTPDFWFFEYFQGTVAYGLRVIRVLLTEQTDYQNISVFDTYKHGRVLTLDGLVMLTEKEEFIYHEMIAHVPMQTLFEPKRAVVIGGGDGGTVRELARYPELEKIVLCEIDRRVVEVCRKYIPSVASGFDDPRVELYFDDGAKYIREVEPGSLDLIIIDSTDPIGPGQVLFTVEFYQNAARALNGNGVLIAQTETPLYHASVVADIYRNLGEAFEKNYMYWASIPTYMGNIWTFAYASRKKHPIKDLAPRPLGDFKFKYYSEQMHRAAFAPPAFALECLPQGHEQHKGII